MSKTNNDYNTTPTATKRECTVPLKNGAVMTEWCIKSTAFVRTHVSKTKKHFSEMDMDLLKVKPRAGSEFSTIATKAPHRTHISIKELLNPMEEEHHNTAI